MQTAKSKENKPSFKRTEDRKSIANIINERLLKKPLTIQLPTFAEKNVKFTRLWTIKLW